MDNQARMDEYIKTARWLLSFNYELEKVRDWLLDEGACGYEAMHAYYAAIILNKGGF